ncbi:MAG TPA: glycosyltransferase family 39 protein [Candidatus Eisenbacteria bacterium]|nr:glycosyltransferase family 39 protein [Candidatus Eisenbacteria bacterium]
MTATTARKSRRPGSARAADSTKARRAPLDFVRFVPLILLLVVAASVTLYLEAEHRIAGRWGFSLDDSWIYAQMARNVATGHGFAFNPGEPVAGSTGPLYTFILALFYALFHEVVWSAKIFGIACLAGSAFAIYRAVRALVPERPGAALAAGLLLATAPALLWGSVSGMEITLYLLLVSLGIDAYARGRPNLATLLWSVGVWVRPDGLFLAMLALVFGPPREIWKRALCAAPPILAFLAFNHAIGGHWMPQTVGVKAHFGIVTSHTVNMIREWGALWGVPYRSTDDLEEPVLLLALLAIGAVLLFRRRPILALYAIGFPIALSLFREHSASHKRYILYVIPFGITLAAVGLGGIASRLGGKRGGAALAALGGACLVWQLAIARGEAETHGWNVQNINEMQRTMGEFARRVTKPGDRIAANDIGAIGYFSERPVVDLVGLITPVEPLPRMLSRYKPELMIVFVDWFRSDVLWDPDSRGFVFLDADSTHKYMIIGAVELKHNTISAKDQMLAFRRLPMDAPAPERLLMEAR